MGGIMIVYGTRVDSDIDFPLDLPTGGETRYEVRLTAGVPDQLYRSVTCGFPLYRSHGRRVYLYSNRLFDGSDIGQPWCYEVKEVVRFYWAGGEPTVYYELDENGDEGLLAFWFIHLFLPLYMTLEGKYDFMHAGAVEVDGRPILFIAPSMGGKSTLTDFFIQKGHTLISDDKVPTFVQEGQFMAVGSHPYHRPYRKYEELGYRVNNFMTEFAPIDAFYVLEPAAADAPIVLDEINGFGKFDRLMPNYLFHFSFLKPRRLHYLGEMLGAVRVFRVQVPRDLERLSEVHEAICAHNRETA
jgi:hypothetical protein